MKRCLRLIAVFVFDPLLWVTIGAILVGCAALGFEPWRDLWDWVWGY